MNEIIHFILAKEAFTLQPIDLRTGVFPYNICFWILYFPGGSNNNVTFTNPHFFLLWTWYPSHADNSIHALQPYPVCPKQTGNCCQNLVILFARSPNPDNFLPLRIPAACITFSFIASIISQINTSVCVTILFLFHSKTGYLWKMLSMCFDNIKNIHFKET